MAIRIEQKGLATTYGQLAHLAGVSQAERRRAEIAEQRAAERDARVYQAQQAALNRAARREMQEFDAQMRIETEKRAKAWEVEKMQIRSQTDFQMEEEQRITRQKEYDAAIRAVQQAIDKGQIDADSEQTKNLLMSLRIKRETGWSPSMAQMRERADKVLTPKQQLHQVMMDALSDKIVQPEDLLPGRGVAGVPSTREKEAEQAYQRYRDNLTKKTTFTPISPYTRPQEIPTGILPHLSRREFFEMWYPGLVEEVEEKETIAGMYTPVALKRDPLSLGL